MQKAPHKPLSVLCVQIANGCSPEFRVWDRVSRSSASELKATVLYNYWGADAGDAPRFQAIADRAGAPRMHPMDFGWRSSATGRGFVERATPHVRFLATLPKALQLARAAQPDVVYSSQQSWDCRAATFLAKRLRVPQVIHLHYHVGEWLHQPVLARLQTCDHVVTVSDFIRGEALRHGVAPEKVTTILNTADPAPPQPYGTREAVRAELGIAPSAPLWGNISRLDPQKGQADILHAFALVRQRFPDARLIIVGTETPWEPGYRTHLERLAAELGVTSSVIFAGFRSDVPRLLAAFDGFLHPSLKEPFGLAMVEAAQAGLPTVAYADGGTPEVVEHGVTGLLADLSEGVQGLAQAWGRLIAEPETARRMGEAARKRIGRFPFLPEVASDKFLATLRHLIVPDSSTEGSSLNFSGAEVIR